LYIVLVYMRQQTSHTSRSVPRLLSFPILCFISSFLLRVHQRVYAIPFLLFGAKPATTGRHGQRPCAGRTRRLGLDSRSVNATMSRFAACCLFLILSFTIDGSRWRNSSPTSFRLLYNLPLIPTQLHSYYGLKLALSCTQPSI
jgi:hypothetical protein